jgi:hypothetical protein
LDRLDEKTLARLKHNARLEERRRYYKPKANGRGRPAQMPKQESQEDQARRAQYMIEISLLNEALIQAADGGEALLQWLSLEREHSAGEKLRLRKIQALLEQFGGKKALIILPSEWKPENVYAYLSALRERQRARLTAFARLPIATLGQQDDEDRERAILAVLERFCTSQHASSRERICNAAKIIALDPILPSKLHDKARYPMLWQDAVKGLVADLLGRFAS